MTDSLTAQGLSVKNNATLLTEIQNFIQNTYSPNGEPIDFSSASPDGQFTNILATIGTTHRELLTQVYNATDPTKCIGTQQDSKYQLNYLWGTIPFWLYLLLGGLVLIGLVTYKELKK